MLIAFDGVDGCGKNTQVELLFKYLEQKSYKCEVLDFGGHPLFIKHMQSINEKNIIVDRKTREYLYYFEGLYNSLSIENDMDTVYIIDRNYLSYLAYGPLNGVNVDEVKELIKYMKKPDLYFYLDIDPQLTYYRIKKYRELDAPEIGFGNKYDEDNEMDKFIDFQNKVRNNYISSIDSRIIKIDANREAQCIHEEVRGYLSKIMDI